MSRCINRFCGFLIALSVLPGLTAYADDQSKSLKLQRTNIVVSDMDRALSFYRDVLGFELFRLVSHKKGSYAYELFSIDPDADLREAMLSSPGQERVLGLTEIREQALPVQSNPSRVAVVIRVDDIDDVIHRAKELGLQLFSRDVLQTVDDRTIHEQGIIDWDGNLMLVYSYVD